MGVSVRHKMFDWGWRSVRSFDVPILSVGNLTVGGTGKTPVVEMLVRELGDTYKIAILSRGYGRKTRGYIEVEGSMSYRSVGDEPKQIKLRFPEVTVVVCEKRGVAIDRIRREHPEVDLIILDDGFQHRQVEAWVNVLLVDNTRPVWQDKMLPWGSLRDNLRQMPRAHYVLVTKCDPEMTALDRRIVRKSLKLFPYQGLYFTSVSAGEPAAVFAEGAARVPAKGAPVVAMSGIGNPAAFEAGLRERYNVVQTLRYVDHHPYRTKDLHDMLRMLGAGASAIVTTEKDAVKLRGSSKIPEEIRRSLFFQPIRVVFDEGGCKEEFVKKLKNDLRTNPRERFLHSH